MTAALMCDNCGDIVSERGAEGEATTVKWLRVEQDPSISLAGLSLNLELAADDEEVEMIDVEPAWHFCCMECLRFWAMVQTETAAKEGA